VTLLQFFKVEAEDMPFSSGFLCSLTRCLAPAPLKLRPYGAIQICLLLLLLLLLYDAHIVSVFTLTEARLAGGETEREGRLEVSYNGVWGTVCADDFDDINAAVACHMLGYG